MPGPKQQNAGSELPNSPATNPAAKQRPNHRGLTNAPMPPNWSGEGVNEDFEVIRTMDSHRPFLEEHSDGDGGTHLTTSNPYNPSVEQAESNY